MSDAPTTGQPGASRPDDPRRPDDPVGEDGAVAVPADAAGRDGERDAVADGEPPREPTGEPAGDPAGDDAEERAAEPAATSRARAALGRVRPRDVGELAVVTTAAVFVLLQLHPSLLVATTTPAGGDMGAHVWGPAFLRDELLPRWRLSGWTPDWYAGFPAFHFYMVVPMLAIVGLDVLVPYEVAFKLVTVAGVVAMPFAAWGLGRLLRVPTPGPALMGVATVPFLFDRSFTIYGGNVASTLAGEFAFSISLALALVALGVVARGLETGRHRALAAVLLALTALTHLIPALFAVAGTVVLWAMRLPARAAVGGSDARHAAARLTAHLTGWVAATGAVALLLGAFWLLPFAWRRDYLNDMGWEKLTAYWENLLPADLRWVIGLAVAGAVVSLVMRRRAGVFLALTAAVFAVAFVLAPQGRLWNARLLPFWYLSLHLLAGLAVGEAVRAVGVLVGPLLRGRAEAAQRVVRGAVHAVGGGLAAAAALVVVGLPLHSLPAGSTVTRTAPDGATTTAYRWLWWETTDRSFLPDWARWNYSGYEQKAAWPEYRAVVDTMAEVGEQHGCGRAMWEYEPELDRYGTPMALMLLPHWTDGCIGSMEGLYFESAATTPFHFLNQSELSASPSRAQRGLPYRGLDASQGVAHLQLLGVRYYMAFSEEALAQADRHPDLREVATSGPWTVYRVLDAPLVEPLRYLPGVLEGVGAAQDEWLDVAVPWYQDRFAHDVVLAADGPDGWPRVAADGLPPLERAPLTDVRGVEAGVDRIRFEVDRPGAPVLVKASYFPNWKADGADGPWRVTPNLMVVVPTDTTVELRYGWTAVDRFGWAATGLGVFALAGLAALDRRRPARVGELGAAVGDARGGEAAAGEPEP